MLRNVYILFMMSAFRYDVVSVFRGLEEVKILCVELVLSLKVPRYVPDSCLLHWSGVLRKRTNGRDVGIRSALPHRIARLLCVTPAFINGFAPV